MKTHTTSITSHNKHHYRELLSIGIPIIIGQLGTIILGFADTLMIGHHSTPELAAAGLVNNIFGLVFVSYMGFTYGLTPIRQTSTSAGITHNSQRNAGSSNLNMVIFILFL